MAIELSCYLAIRSVCVIKSSQMTSAKTLLKTLKLSLTQVIIPKPIQRLTMLDLTWVTTRK
jgi:hypothetical protein